MYGVEGVETILEYSKLSASFFVIEIYQDKGRKCQIFGVKTAQEHIGHYKVYGLTFSKDIENNDEGHSITVIVGL